MLIIVQQPIVVVRREDKYEVIIGQRRFEASKLAGKTTIPSVIRTIRNDNEAVIASFSENIHRLDLTYKDKNMRNLTVAVLLIFCILQPPTAQADVFLPGMQPKEAGIEFAKVQQCKMCHSKTKNGNADPFFSWQGGMMAQSTRDPLYRAALTIANQDIEGVGEFSI